MKLRNQLILAFFLFSVVPLTGVTLFSYYSSRRAFRQAAETESVALAKDMERRMDEVTGDLQQRIDRLSVLPQWAAFSSGGAVDSERWNLLAHRLEQDLGNAAGLLERIEFTPAEPPSVSGSVPKEVALPAAPAAPSKFLIDLSESADIGEEFVVETVGDRVLVRRRGKPADVPGDTGAAPPAVVIDPDAARSKMEEFKQGVRALSRELADRDEKRRAGIDVPVAQPEEFEFLLAHELGSPVLSDGKTLGTVRGQISTRKLLGRVLSRTRRERGEIPFAVNADGKMFTPDPADLTKLEPLKLAERVRLAKTGELAADPNWVTVLETDISTGLTFGISRPVGDSLDRMRNAAATNLALGLALVGLALGGIIPLSRRMTRNLHRLTDGAERLAGGDLSSRVPLRSRDEFGKLAGTFNRMARQLGENQRRLVEQERLRKELELCRQIQNELLPQGIYRSPGAHVTGISIPAKELGGDFFNHFPLGDGQLGILVGDVSGKGVGAALLMANVQATLRARLPLERDLAKLAGSLDREIGENTPDEVYLTLFLGILDPHRHVLRYINGGHTPPLVIHHDARVDRLVPCGRPPGLLPGGGYEERSVAMYERDSLFLYTDGLVEAEDDAGLPFGVDRLESLLIEERHLELEGLLGRVQSELSRHQGSGEAADDATLVVLRIPDGNSAPAAEGNAGFGISAPAGS